MTHTCRPTDTGYVCGACGAELEECTSCLADLSVHEIWCFDPRPR